MPRQPIAKNKKAVVLISGGLDSAVTLYYALKRGFLCFGLIFDYGQRHKREIESAKRICGICGCNYELIRIRLPWKGSSLLDNSLAVESRFGRPRSIPNTYVPGRNIIFLSFASSFAEVVGANTIFIGAHTQDYSGYPDCRWEFLKVMEDVLALGTRAGSCGDRIKIEAPLIRMVKSQIIRLGLKLGVPFQHTWSCYRGGRYPCGRCDSCLYRAKGFQGAGLEDPLLVKQ